MHHVAKQGDAVGAERRQIWEIFTYKMTRAGTSNHTYASSNRYTHNKLIFIHDIVQEYNILAIINILKVRV